MRSVSENHKFYLKKNFIIQKRLFSFECRDCIRAITDKFKTSEREHVMSITDNKNNAMELRQILNIKEPKGIAHTSNVN